MTLLTHHGGKIPLMVSATWDEVRARRLARSSLATRAPAARLVDIAHDLGGVHAQVQASAELQLASRVDGIAQGDVREALWERRLLVKAWTLRGTLHLHPADELGPLACGQAGRRRPAW
jgi:Winged helix DNA-binding domain